ncbi:hypothetical protein ACFX19_025481 [Malus domestica]
MISAFFKLIYDIFQLLPSKVQVGVFSATMPPEALEITRMFMNKPVRILVKRTDMGGMLEIFSRAEMACLVSSGMVISRRVAILSIFAFVDEDAHHHAYPVYFCCPPSCISCLLLLLLMKMPTIMHILIL